MRRESDDAEHDMSQVARVERVLGRIEPADAEREHPPADLWGRIAASLAGDPAIDSSGAGTVVEYWIDAEDEVMVVGADWSTFARDNQAAELAGTTPDRTLWSYFDSDEVRDLWRLLVERVRAKQSTAQVPLRCDAARVRRWFEMTVTPLPDGAVHFRCTLVFEEPRPAVDLLDTFGRRDPDAPAVPVCSWCGDAHDGDGWRPVEDVVRALRLLEQELLPPIRHGVCPRCRDQMSANLVTGVRSRASRQRGVDRNGQPPDAAERATWSGPE